MVLPFSHNLGFLIAIPVFLPKYIQCLRVCVCVCVFIAQSGPTLCDLMDHSPPGFSVHGILQARILEWIATPSSRAFLRTRD